MTQQQINDIIINHIGIQLNEQTNVADRVGAAFSSWFNSLIAPPPMPVQQPEEQQ